MSRLRRFLEKRFDLRGLTAMQPAFQCGKRADHYLVWRSAGRSDTSRRKSRNIQFVIRAEDESRAESRAYCLSPRRPGFLQGHIRRLRSRAATYGATH